MKRRTAEAILLCNMLGLKSDFIQERFNNVEFIYKSVLIYVYHKVWKTNCEIRNVF